MKTLKNLGTTGAIAAVSVLTTPLTALATGYGEQYGHMGMGNGGWSIFGHGMMFLFWIAIIVLVVLAVRYFIGNGTKSGKGNAAAILEERLAKGEIDPEEYNMRRKALEG